MKHRQSDMSLPEPGTLNSILDRSAEKHPGKVAVALARGISYTYGELGELTNRLAHRLYGLGIEKGDRIAIISENHPHWSLAYFSILQSGGVTVPVLPDFQYREMYSILEHSEAAIAFLSFKQLQKFAEGFPPNVRHVMVIEDMSLHHTEEVPLTGQTQAETHKVSLDPDSSFTSRFPANEPGDLASIIYTSGTTGRSKGVMLTHDNLYFNAHQAGTIHEVVSDDVFLSVLPLAHTYECTIGMLVPFIAGATIHYIDRAPTASYLAPLMQELRPTTMLTVPLIMEKIYRSKIKPGIDSKKIMKGLASFAPTRKLLHYLAGKKLKAFFGNRIRFFGVGGAPLSPDVEKFLIEARFPYAIGYGLTETSPLLAGFGPNAQVYKSVGTVLEGVSMRIDRPDPVTGEGEIVVHGRNIMKGYYRNEEETGKVFTEDGYFRTGDLGIIDSKGILFIKGRLKNMILGPNGENIYPEEIEAVINGMQYVSESLVFQHKGKLTALVYLNLEQLEEKFQHVLQSAHDAQMVITEKAEEMLEDMKDTINQHLSSNSRLQMVMLQTVPFEKTPTQKIKRFLYSS